MSVELSKQKLDIDEAARAIHGYIQELQYKEKVLLRGMEALDQGQDMLNDEGILAGEVRKVMRDMSLKISYSNLFYNLYNSHYGKRST